MAHPQVPLLWKNPPPRGLTQHFVNKLPSTVITSYFLAFVVIALLARNTSFASEGNGKLDAKPMYIGLQGKSLDIKWMYIAENMYKEVIISHLMTSNVIGKIKLWKIHYFASNKSSVTFKIDAPNNTFNNLTELTSQTVSMQSGRVRVIFHLRIKSIPRNISSFGFLCSVKPNNLWTTNSEKIITIKVAG